MMKNQSGFVTTEFLFAIGIAFFLTIVTFSMTFTLSIVEVVQYAVFSASRAHAAANFDVEAQKWEAQTKYNQLVDGPVLKHLFTEGWFEVSKGNQLEIRSGSGDNFEKDYAPNDNRSNMQGVRTTFKANLLEMRLPFLGNITPEDQFSAKLNAILIREVSQDECIKFMEQRKEELWSFDGQNRFQKFKNKNGVVPVTPWEDNGC